MSHSPGLVTLSKETKARGEGVMVSVFLLGPIRVVRAGRLVEGGWRRKALELLAYLAVHPEGAAKDQILEALWPEGDPGQTQQYLWHSVSRLRDRARGRDRSLQIVSKVDDMYRLDFKGVWVDVAEFHRALVQARTTEDPREALESACDIYKGEFCEGRYFGWATLARERLARLFLQASGRLAACLEDRGRVEDALAVLDRAIECDPYDEGLVRLAMKLDSRLGRVDRVARRWKYLRRLHLEDLAVEPSPETMSAFRSLVSESGSYSSVIVRPVVHNRRAGCPVTGGVSD